MKIDECINVFRPVPYNRAQFEDVWDSMVATSKSINTAITFGWYRDRPEIEKVIFNDPATIVFWSDGTKTVVKCQDDEIFDKEKGLAMAISKKFLGNQGNYYNVFKRFVPADEDTRANYFGTFGDGEMGRCLKRLAEEMGSELRITEVVK